MQPTDLYKTQSSVVALNAEGTMFECDIGEWLERISKKDFVSIPDNPRVGPLESARKKILAGRGGPFSAKQISMLKEGFLLVSQFHETDDISEFIGKVVSCVADANNGVIALSIPEDCHWVIEWRAITAALDTQGKSYTWPNIASSMKIRVVPGDPTYYRSVAKPFIPPPPPEPLTVELLSKVALPLKTKQEIISVLTQHQFKDKLFNEWGLGEVIAYGRGMIFLFHGLPGTGKTYTAKLMGKAIDKEVMVLGPAELQSSTPGDYERNLKQAFEEATEQGKILFFDEADGMIQSRQGMGQIMSGENNTFLQEVEKFEGILIMATNRVNALDEALERRISLIIEFPMPDQDQRKDIWKLHLPSKLPLAPDVDHEALSTYHLTGGEIKNVVLNAARTAIGTQAEAVTMQHFTDSIAKVMEGKTAFATGRRSGNVQQGQGQKVRDVRRG